MSNFGSRIPQAHGDKTGAGASLPALYPRKADENADIQEAKDSVKEAF